MTKRLSNKKKNKKVHNPITYNYTKKYIYINNAIFFGLLLLFELTR